jgi:hypothetical protein
MPCRSRVMAAGAALSAVLVALLAFAAAALPAPLVVNAAHDGT